MYKLRATISKDVRVLLRDRIGLIFMFAMPILLVLIVTSIQNSTFELVGKNKVSLLVSNHDTGAISRDFIRAVDKIGFFELIPASAGSAAVDSAGSGHSASTGSASLSGVGGEDSIRERIRHKDALLGLVIPADFSARIAARAKSVTGKVQSSFGLDSTVSTPGSASGGGAVDSGSRAAPGSGLLSGGDTAEMPIALYYHPVLQESFRRSAEGALYSALQLVESRQILRTLYYSLNEKELPDSLERQLLNSRTHIDELAVSRDGNRDLPNATQHNIPSWTIFAMFFVVLSLGSGIVREKRNGSFIRLKTLPTSYVVAILSKQLTYLVVTLAQAAVIFALGAWLFPFIGLPALHYPGDWAALIVVTLLCGWCAVSYAICIGVFAQTEEQANGFGAVSIVILAAVGGLMVPSFAMPGSFHLAMSLSPLHWCLEAYYGLFLEGGSLKDVWANILPLFLIIAALQGLSFWGLKRKNLI
ncbi:MAG TPA: ABC transporter permease [Puia sp.]|nr:ABC transporter permease [Puia sp.]